jgi:hypothetical protein
LRKELEHRLALSLPNGLDTSEAMNGQASDAN